MPVVKKPAYSWLERARPSFCVLNAYLDTWDGIFSPGLPGMVGCMFFVLSVLCVLFFFFCCLDLSFAHIVQIFIKTVM